MYHLISSYYTTDVCSVHFKSVHIYIETSSSSMYSATILPEESSESLELQSFMDIFIQMTFRDIRRLEIMIFSSN